MNNVNLEDLYIAYQDCRKHKKNKNGAKKFSPCAIYKLQLLQEDLNNNKYKLSQSKCFIIEYPKPREIFCTNFRDRIIQHFVFNELNPIIDKMLIYDAANCRKNKGTDFAITRVWKFIKQASSKSYGRKIFYLKADISGFFMCIDRNILLNKVLSVINTKYSGKYKQVLNEIVPVMILTDITKNTYRVCNIEKWDRLPKRKTLFGNDYGIPVGNLCSQLYANLYLNDLDHTMKSRHRYYSRYVDDIVIIDYDYNKLEESKHTINEVLSTINLQLSDNKTYINSVSNGVRYLGNVIYNDYIKMQSRKIKHILESKFDSEIDAYQKVSCRLGLMKRFKGYNLLIRWINKINRLYNYNLKLNNKKSKLCLNTINEDIQHIK